MKNKEIEELLNYIDQFVYVDQTYNDIKLSKIDCKLLLSYIEQLQTTANECKQDYQRMKENFDSKVDVIATLSKENKQLENNRDKAIEIIKKDYYKLNSRNIDEISDTKTDIRITLYNILKGDSDE